MRLIGRLLGLLILCLLLIAFVFWILPFFENNNLTQSASQKKGWKRSVAYEINSRTWTSFQLTSNKSLRLINTPLTHEGVIDSGKVTWHYSLDFQLMDASKQLIREWTYHYRTKMTGYLDPETGDQRQRAYVTGLNLLPANSRVLELPEDEIKQARFLRVRLNTKNPSIERVLVRAYMLMRQSEQKLDYLWARLSTRAKHDLADASLYGTKYLRLSEKKNLIRWRWRPIGPMGVLDKDFTPRIIHSLLEDLEVTVDDPVLPEGLYLDAKTHAVFTIPEGSWDLKVLLYEAIKSSASHSVEMRWQAKDGQSSWQKILISDQQEVFTRSAVEAGTIVFSSKDPMVVKPLLFNDGKLQLLPSQSINLRSYLIENNQIIEFDMHHNKDSLTPLRVDFRRIWRDDDLSVASVKYQFIDTNGQVIDETKVSIDKPASVYDRIKSLDDKSRLSESKRLFLRLSKQVAKVRFISQKPIAIVVYTRPSNLRRMVRVPEDYQKIRWDPLRHPAWFYLRAMGHDERLKQHQVVDLALQIRPKEVNEDILAGRYQRLDVEPEGNHFSRQLMIPRTTNKAVLNRSRVGVYSPVKPQETQTLNFIGHKGRQTLSPTLVYVGKQAIPHNVTVYLDGKKVVSTRIFSSRSQLSLGSLKRGQHQLRIDTKADGQWWVNYATPQPNSQLMRHVWPLSKGRQLTFEYAKTSNELEVLTGTLYCEKPERTHINLDISLPDYVGKHQSEQWTFDKRSFDVRIDDNDGIPVFGNSRQLLYAGQVFFVPLREDLISQNYAINVSYSGDNRCYITLHHLLLGNPSMRRFFRQDDGVASL